MTILISILTILVILCVVVIIDYTVTLSTYNGRMSDRDVKHWLMMNYEGLRLNTVNQNIISGKLSTTFNYAVKGKFVLSSWLLGSFWHIHNTGIVIERIDGDAYKLMEEVHKQLLYKNNKDLD